MSDGPVEQIKKFVFTSGTITSHAQHSNGETHESQESNQTLEIYIPELLQASYSFYTWPSASVLAWFLWEHRLELTNKRILELGAGTSLPGIVAAKCGATVTLTDSAKLPKSLQHIHKCVKLNNLVRNIRVIGLTWGLFLHEIFQIGPLDLIIASDCFYEPCVFEDILVTVSHLLKLNPLAKFVFAYQERSSDWSIEPLLKKWNLKCTVIDTANLGAASGFNLSEITGDHSIHLFDLSYG